MRLTRRFWGLLAGLFLALAVASFAWGVTAPVFNGRCLVSIPLTIMSTWAFAFCYDLGKA